MMDFIDNSKIVLNGKFHIYLTIMSHSRFDNRLPTFVSGASPSFLGVPGTFGVTNAGGYSKDNPNCGKAPGQNKTILHNPRLLFRSTLPD